MKQALCWKPIELITLYKNNVMYEIFKEHVNIQYELVF